MTYTINSSYIYASSLEIKSFQFPLCCWDTPSILTPHSSGNKICINQNETEICRTTKDPPSGTQLFIGTACTELQIHSAFRMYVEIRLSSEGGTYVIVVCEESTETYI